MELKFTEVRKFVTQEFPKVGDTDKKPSGCMAVARSSTGVSTNGTMPLLMPQRVFCGD